MTTIKVCNDDPEYDVITNQIEDCLNSSRGRLKFPIDDYRSTWVITVDELANITIEMLVTVTRYQAFVMVATWQLLRVLSIPGRLVGMAIDLICGRTRQDDFRHVDRCCRVIETIDDNQSIVPTVRLLRFDDLNVAADSPLKMTINRLMTQRR